MSVILLIGLVIITLSVPCTASPNIPSIKLGLDEILNKIDSAFGRRAKVKE